MNTFDELWTMLREETGGENPGDETPVVPRQQTDSDVTTGEPIEYAAQTLEPAETTTGEEANHAAFPTATEDMAAAETELQESDLPLVSPLDDRAYSHLADIQKFASWCFGEDGERRLKCAIDLFSSEYTGHDDEIERAIEKLPREEVFVLTNWLSTHFSDLWDRQIEDDISNGLLDELAAEALAEHRAGKSLPLPTDEE